LQFAGNEGKLHFNLRNYSTKADVLAAVDRLKYLGENTNTTGGLQVARLEVFDAKEQKRPGVDQIVVLITDGIPTKDVEKLDAEVTAIKNRSIRILGLGVTNKVCLKIICPVLIALLQAYLLDMAEIFLSQLSFLYL